MILPVEITERNPDAAVQLPLDMFNESGIPPVMLFLPLSEQSRK